MLLACNQAATEGAQVGRAEAKQGGAFFGYYVVFALALTTFGPVSFGHSCAGIFYPSAAADLGVGVGTLSYFTPLACLTACLALPFLGRAISTFDPRRCIEASLVVVAIAFLVVSFSTSLVQYLIGGAVMGVGTATLIYLAPSTLVNRWFKRRAGFFLGIIMAFTGIGGVVWSAIGGVLIQEVGWAWTYRVFAVLTLAIFPVVHVCVVGDPRLKGQRPYGEGERAADDPSADASAESRRRAAPARSVDAAEALRMPEFYLIFIACFALSFGMYLNSMIASYVSTLAIGVAFPLLGAFATSASMAAQTGSKLLLGFAGDRFPYAGTVAGASCGLVGIVLLFVGTGSEAVVLVGAFSFGIYYGVVNVMMPIVTRRCFGDGDYPVIYSRVSMAATISGVLSGFLWGTLIEVTGSYVVMFVGVAAFIVAAILAVLGVSALQARRARVAATASD